MFENLWKLLTEEWKFTRPCVILSLADGSVDKNCRDLHDDLLETLTKLVNDTSKLFFVVEFFSELDLSYREY